VGGVAGVDEFLDLVQSKAATLSIGPGIDDHDLGPIVFKEQYAAVTGYVAEGTREGAGLRSGGKRPRHLQRGYFIEPTLFDRVDANARIARKEIFGPVGVAIVSPARKRR